MDKKNIALTDDNNLIITTSVNTIANGDDIMDGDGQWTIGLRTLCILLYVNFPF